MREFVFGDSTSVSINYHKLPVVRGLMVYEAVGPLISFLCQLGIPVAFAGIASSRFVWLDSRVKFFVFEIICFVAMGGMALVVSSCLSLLESPYFFFFKTESLM